MSGVIGIYSFENEDIGKTTFLANRSVEHRGEDGFGLSFSNKDLNESSIITWREKFESVSEFLDNEFYDTFEKISPNSVVTHTRYAKSKYKARKDKDPIQIKKKSKGKYDISVSMDGTILNPEEIMKELDKYKFEKKTETECLGALFSNYLEKTDEIREAGRKTMEKLYGRGLYSATFLVNDGDETKVVGMRDPTGNKSLSVGSENDTYILSSETLTFNKIGEFNRYVNPGEMLVFPDDIDEVERGESLIEKPHAHCMFKFIYFDAPPSHFEGRNISKVRRKSGEIMANKYKTNSDKVVPFPRSGIEFGKGYADTSGIYFETGALFLPPTAKRTFQMSDKKKQEMEVESKFIGNKSLLKGLEFDATDDSIVFGSVSGEGAMGALRKNEVKKANLLISCAPLCFHCPKYFGAPLRPLAAQDLEDRSIEEINEIVGKKIGIDTVDGELFYQTKEGVEEAIDLDDLCMACVDGKYPINREFLPEKYKNKENVYCLDD